MTSQAGHWRSAVAIFALFEERATESFFHCLIVAENQELELKTTNISHTSLMGALAPGLQQMRIQQPQPTYATYLKMESGETSKALF